MYGYLRVKNDDSIPGFEVFSPYLFRQTQLGEVALLGNFLILDGFRYCKH
jgi:hypothetical protein